MNSSGPATSWKGISDKLQDSFFTDNLSVSHGSDQNSCTRVSNRLVPGHRIFFPVRIFKSSSTVNRLAGCSRVLSLVKHLWISPRVLFLCWSKTWKNFRIVVSRSKDEEKEKFEGIRLHVAFGIRSCLFLPRPNFSTSSGVSQCWVRSFVDSSCTVLERQRDHCQGKRNASIPN